MTVGVACSWGKAIKRLTNLAINTIVQDTVPPEGPKELEPPPIVASAMKHKEAEAAKVRPTGATPVEWT